MVDSNDKKITEKSEVALKEERILKFWQENKIFEKSLKKNEGEKEYIFYDGPPFATGLPHYGHILPGTIKDVIPKFETMRGKYVRRRWGWDCHGLPIENLVEKELGLGTKKDIESYGVEKFNQVARNAVFRYVDEWKKIIPRTGRFVDMENAYVTMDSSYTESVWWSFKTLYEKGLVYEGYKVMPYCPRCGTTLSNFEVNQGYKDITDISVYVKFELEDTPNIYLLVWTTTPWTLSGNTALAIKSEVIYVKAKKDDVFYILAKDLVEKVLKENYEIVEEFIGKKLIGKKYKPVFDYYSEEYKDNNKIWKIYSADFVTTEDGTGIVHIAPAFGGDDYELSVKENLPIIHHVNLDGTFKAEVTDFAGQLVKPKDDSQKADIEIIKYLAHKGLLFEKEKIIHSYPHCWRCDTPLLNYATSSWFVKVTDVKNKLIKENKKINWNPENIRDGRFGKWLEGAKDWAVSRSRYWGAPLPVWKCDDCKKTEFIGSLEELRKKTSRGNRFIIVRHGEAVHNVKNMLSGIAETPHHLTDKGKKESKSAGEKLKKEKIDIIISSPFVRTRETADIIADAINYPKEKIEIDNRIEEVRFGIFEGKNAVEYHKWFKSSEEYFTKTPEGGENFNDIRIRVGKFLYDIDSKYENKNILVVSHDTPAWLMFGVNKGETMKQLLTGEVKDDFIPNAGIKEINFAKISHNYLYELDFHRPYIDSVDFNCKCGGDMKRVPEVFDTWYDSGSVPFAKDHYPFDKKEISYPADFIAEGLDQTRGWFYTLLVLNVALFGKTPYKNVVVNGILLAEDGKKMAKRLKNYPEISYIFDKYGADSLRYFLMSSPAVRAEDVCFSEKAVDEVYKKIILRLYNVLSFYELYGYPEAGSLKPEAGSDNILDKWIVARLQQTTFEITEAMNHYEIDKAIIPISLFVDDLSTWYVRRSRDRFKSEDVEDRNNALTTIRNVLIELSKIMAPFTPFIAEEIYKKVGGEAKPNQNDLVARSANGGFRESVHLEDWPACAKATAWQAIMLKEMTEVRRIVSIALEQRSKANIKVRQPLGKLKLKVKIANELAQLIKEELNVKEVLFDDTIKNEAELDITISSELKIEGDYREFLRSIQELRKKENLSQQDKVTLIVNTNEDMKKIIEKFKPELLKNAGLLSIEYAILSEGNKIAIKK
ncbi:MAG: class I tRNA ligase family protein [Patescibacteria group bacterium]|nr:class I tRNA ligase family protein [Patescibacteria group bacterium]